MPGAEGTATLQRLAQRGVKVRVLTNSLAATDVPPVHAGYAKRRCDLLRAGVQLYELKPSASVEGIETRSKLGSAPRSNCTRRRSSSTDERIFVGSFNFDQRSAHLNTEMGLVIDSPVLARRIADAFDADLGRNAYAVRIAADGRCPEWIEQTAAGEVLHEVEPETNGSQRAWIQFLEELPIEWLL